uniref:Uncharacterized protein n=1 Tax=Arcella intermedia TaxID=1963864 RepID=A0A6B2LP00_9EUKA
MGNDGVIAICESLKVNSTLTSLILSNNRIENNGLVSIYNSIKDNSNLTTLNIGTVSNDEGQGLVCLLKEIPLSNKIAKTLLSWPTSHDKFSISTQMTISHLVLTLKHQNITKDLIIYLITHLHLWFPRETIIASYH